MACRLELEQPAHASGSGGDAVAATHGASQRNPAALQYSRLADGLAPWFDAGMDDELSTDPVHKLQAVLNHDRTDADKDFPPGYLAACWRWFHDLPARDQVAAAIVRAEFENGNEAEAQKAAAALPPAPVCPLL